MGPLSFSKPPWVPGVSLTSTQMALELSLEVCWHGYLQASFPTLQSTQVPGERGGLIPVLPGRVNWPFLPGTRSPSAVACHWDVGANFAEPSFKADLNCQSCFHV